MAQPDVRSTIVAGPLQDVAIRFRSGEFIGDQVFPIIDKVAPKAKILTYSRGAWFRDEAGIRGPGARAPRGGYPTGTIDVVTKEYAFGKEVTDEDRRNASVAGAPPLNPDSEAIEFAAGKIDIKKERLIRDLIIATTWVDGNSGGEDADGKWAASSTNTFLIDITTGIKAIHNATGIKPNRLIMDLGTLLSLKEESTLLDKIKYTQTGVLTPELIAAVLGLEKVLIGTAFYSSAKESKAGTDFTAVPIWETTATKGMGFLYYAPPAPSLKLPSSGYQARIAYEDGQARRVTTWRENAEHQDVYEVAEETHIVATASSLGYLWKDTLLT